MTRYPLNPPTIRTATMTLASDTAEMFEAEDYDDGAYGEYVYTCTSTAKITTAIQVSVYEIDEID